MSLTDNDFKKKMGEIAKSTGQLDKHLKNSKDNLELLEKAMNNFKGDKIPNKIELSVSEKTILETMKKITREINFDDELTTIYFKPSFKALKESITDWIENKLGKGQFIKHLPLKLQWGPLRDSINDFLEAAGKGKRGLNKLPLKAEIVQLTQSKKSKESSTGGSGGGMSSKVVDAILKIAEALTDQGNIGAVLGEIKEKTGTISFGW